MFADTAAEDSLPCFTSGDACTSPSGVIFAFALSVFCLRSLADWPEAVSPTHSLELVCATPRSLCERKSPVEFWSLSDERFERTRRRTPPSPLVRESVSLLRFTQSTWRMRAR